MFPLDADFPSTILSTFSSSIFLMTSRVGDPSGRMSDSNVFDPSLFRTRFHVLSSFSLSAKFACALFCTIRVLSRIALFSGDGVDGLACGEYRYAHFDSNLATIGSEFDIPDVAMVLSEYQDGMQNKDNASGTRSTHLCH